MGFTSTKTEKNFFSGYTFMFVGVGEFLQRNPSVFVNQSLFGLFGNLRGFVLGGHDQDLLLDEIPDAHLIHGLELEGGFIVADEAVGLGLEDAGSNVGRCQQSRA